MGIAHTAAATTAALLLLTGCLDESSRPLATAAPSGDADRPGAPAASATVAAPDFTIDFRGGKVGGDTGRLKVKRGDEVTIEVTSDVADEVHLHGYDLRVPVTPGPPTRLTFTADVPGVFELELESTHRLLARIQVQ